MNKLLIINTIPTPYRTFMFNKIAEIGKQHNFEFEVFYQARMDTNRRQWDPSQMNLKHQHFFSKNWMGRERTTVSYFQPNLDLLWALRNKKYSHILYSPVGSIMGWFARFFIPPETKVIYWVESNLASTVRKGFLAKWLKKRLLQDADCFACSGVRSKEYLHFFMNKTDIGRIFYLPNLIDFSIYNDNTLKSWNDKYNIRVSLALPINRQIILAVGEICERKGIDQLIRAACCTEGSYLIIVLGAGKSLLEWQEWIRQEHADSRICLKGYCKEEDVVKYMAIADWFVHAARRDPSPLVCIEAVCAGLPVVISEQTGNQPEVLENGCNGFSFNAADIQDVSSVLRKMINTSTCEREEMAKRSRDICNDRFRPEMIIGNFFEMLKNLNS